jgi:hypothetical protein
MAMSVILNTRESVSFYFSYTVPNFTCLSNGEYIKILVCLHVILHCEKIYPNKSYVHLEDLSGHRIK